MLKMQFNHRGQQVGKQAQHGEDAALINKTTSKQLKQQHLLNKNLSIEYCQ